MKLKANTLNKYMTAMLLFVIAVMYSPSVVLGQTCDGTSISIDENAFPQTCISTAADDTGVNASETFDVDITSDGTNDITVTMTASCANAANDGDGNTTTIAACLGPNGLDTNTASSETTANTDPFDLGAPNGAGVSGGSDFGYVSINDDACASCIVEVCYDFINGFESGASGLDIDWSSMNGGTEAQESFVGWIEGTNNTTSTPITGYTSSVLTDGSYCFAQVDGGLTAGEHLTGTVAGGTLPAGFFAADEITGGGQAIGCAEDLGEGNGEPPSSSGTNSTVSTGMGDNVIAMNWGFGTDDITVTRLCMVYFGSNNNADACAVGTGAELVSEANSGPSGSLSSVTFCQPPVEVECGACTEGTAGLVITELSYDPSSAQGNDGDCEYVELFNSYSNSIVTSTDVTIALSNGVSATLPAGTTILPGEYIIITGPNFGGCTWATPPPAGTQVFDLGIAGGLSNAGEDLTVTLACASDVTVDFIQTVTFSDGTTPAAGGGGSSVYYPLDGSGPLEGAPTPGSGDCAGCANTEFTCSPAVAPEITITKDDSTPTPGDAADTDGDDSQQVLPGGDATFTIEVCNTGTENLCNVVITDTATDTALDVTVCDNDATATAALIMMAEDANGAMDGDMDFEPGECFSYTCVVTDVTTDFTNTIAVTADGCTSMEEVVDSDPTEVTVPCIIENVAVTQNCTGTNDEYELCISFDYFDIGASGTFNVYLDPAATAAPTTVIGGPYTYAAYDAAIAGGATCFTIPVADYIGDAADEEAGLNVCISDADAPAPNTGLPPGTPSAGGGLPNAACPAVLGIFVNACGSNEGQNEFVVFQNGNTAITGGDIVLDTPSGDDYDTWEPAATTDTNIATAGWNCACCVGADASTAIPANATVIVTGNALDQGYDFSGLCSAAGTVYVLGESDAGTGGHFANSGGRSLVLNVTNPGGGCTYPQSYTYLSSDLANSGDGDYISFSAPDNPTQTAGNNSDPAGTSGTGSNNGCTGPEVVAAAEVECFACATLDEALCVTCDVDAGEPTGGPDTVCESDAAVIDLSGNFAVSTGTDVLTAFTLTDPSGNIIDENETGSFDFTGFATGSYCVNSIAYTAASVTDMLNAIIAEGQTVCVPDGAGGQLCVFDDLGAADPLNDPAIIGIFDPVAVGGITALSDLISLLSGNSATILTLADLQSALDDGVDISINGIFDLAAVPPGVGAGLTCFDISDASYCVDIIASPTITVTSTDPTACAATDGTFTIAGLTAGDTYTINYTGTAGTPPSGTSVAADASGEIEITGIGAGTYTGITVTDANGCTSAPGSAVLADPNSPDPTGLTISVDDVCIGDDATVTITGANILTDATYTLTYDIDGTVFTQVVTLTSGGSSFTITAPATGGTVSITSIEDANGCSTGLLASDVFVVNPLPDAGTNGTIPNICDNSAEGNTIADLVAALGGTPDAGGVWTETTTSGVSLATPTMVDFNGIAPGAYTFTYTVSAAPCPDATADVVVTVVECTNPIPSILIDKDDADNTDDTQTVAVGGTATFTITVTNNGTEDLCNIVLTDTPTDGALNVTMCQPTFLSIDTDAGAVAAGSGDDELLIGESETYTCTVMNVTADFTNTISVTADGCDSGEEVVDEDPTTVLIEVDACLIENLAATQNCTNNGDAYELCIAFDYNGTGTSGTFDVYLDPAGTGTPATTIGTYTYAAYDAALAGGAACFTIPIADYAGDASDLEANLEVCVSDTDAPAPGTGLAPGTPPPSGGGIPSFNCPQIYGILHNACAPPNGDEGPNEFVVIVNGAASLDVSNIVVDTPTGNDYDDFNTTTTPATWTCPCCTYLDETGSVPAGGVIVATSAANTSTLDFTSLCASAGTIYVLQDDGVGSTGHFSNGDPRTTLLNLSGTASCDGSTSYTYTNSNGADGDYTTFNSPDSPAYPTAGNNGTDNASADVVNTTGDCTPSVVAAAEVECFSCTTLSEVSCNLACPQDITAVLSGGATLCADATNTDLIITIAGGGTGPYSLVYTDGTANVPVLGYNSGTPIPVSPTVTTTYTLLSVVDANSCIGTVSGTAIVTVVPLPNAGTAGVAQVCDDSADGNSIADLVTALGGTPDAGGTWTETTASGVSLANPAAVDFNGIAVGTYTFTYTVSAAPCTDATADVVVTVADCQAAVPDISIDKDDADNTDDTQVVFSGNTATFTITVTNEGTEDLCNVVVTDPNGLSCEATYTDNGGTLVVGDSWTYTCTVTDVTADFINTAFVNATGCGTGTPVDDEDPTTVTLGVCDLLVEVVPFYQGDEGGISPFYYNKVDVDIHGGTPPYTYQWTTTGYVRQAIVNSPDPTAFPDGDREIRIIYGDHAIWYVTATDFNGCQVTATNDPVIVGGEDKLLDVFLDFIQPASECYEDDGEVHVYAEGGIQPYTYDYSGPFTATNVDTTSTPQSGVIVPPPPYGQNGVPTGGTPSFLIENCTQGWYTVTIQDSGNPVAAGEEIVPSQGDQQTTTQWYWVHCHFPYTNDDANGGSGRGKVAAFENGLGVVAYPNPFAESTNLVFGTAKTTKATVSVYNVAGQKVADLFDGTMQAHETYNMELDGSRLSAGIYMVRILTEDGQSSYEKLILTK